MQKERVDKAAMGYDYKGETEKHQSQKGHFNLLLYPGPQSMFWSHFGGRIVYKAVF